MLAWVFWLHRWAPAVAVVAFVLWVILHRRLEAGLGDALQSRWRRAWRPGPLPIVLLLASTLIFLLTDARTEAKVLPVALDALALSIVVFGGWWRRVAVPRWLGGDGVPPPLVRNSDVIALDALARKGEGS